MQKDVFSLKLGVCFLLFFCFLSSNVEALEALPARFSASGYAGNYTVGQADLMLSLEGNQQHNWYVNPQVAYGSDELWYGDLGLGYRWIKNDAAILGWYVFAGQTRVENNSDFWIANPGLEIMGSRWDGRINAYIPVAGRSHEVGMIVGQPSFTGHTEIPNVFNETQQIGNGADAKVAYQFFQHVPLKSYVGVYFFDIPHTDNVLGGAAGVEYWFNRNIRIFADYSYDNYQRNTIVGGLGVSFGGVRKEMADPSLSERLMDPVERYLANLGHGSGIPSRTILSPAAPINNIAFFSQTGTPNIGGTNLTLANCTFENPCGPTDFSQTGVNTLSTLLPDTLLYFNGGSYPASNGAAALALNNGQGVFSRTSDYSSPVTDAARSTFNGGGLVLNGNNSLNEIILQGLSNVPAVTIQGSNNSINNSSISGGQYALFEQASGASVTVNNSGIAANQIGFFVDNGTSATVNNSSISADQIGLFADNGASATVNGSSISANQIGILMTGPGTSAVMNGSSIDANQTGLLVTSSGTSLTINDSRIGGIGTTGIGLVANGSGTITVANGSVINAFQTGLLVSSNSIPTSVTVANSTISAIGSGSVLGISANGPSSVQVVNTQVTASGGAAGSTTLNTDSVGGVNITATDSVLTANGPLPTDISNGGSGIIINTSTCMVNGSAVNC